MAEEYLETLLAQIREKRARERVRREIKGHIEEQKNAYIANGIEESEAERMAVRDMGDPVEAGEALDRVHRPKPAWGMLALAGLFCMAGVLLQYLILVQGHGQRYYLSHQLRYAVAGFLLLCVVYLMDYTRIVKYRFWIYAGLVGYMLLNGQVLSRVFYVPFYSLIVYLFVPVCGAMMYSLRQGAKGALCKALLICILPIVLSFGVYRLGACNLWLVFAAMFSLAAFRGWYGMKKRFALPLIWSVTFLLPSIVLIIPLVSGYGQMRIQAWLQPERYANGAGYIGSKIHQILEQSRFIGTGAGGEQIARYLPGLESDHVLIYILSYYGILAALVLVAAALFLAGRLFHLSIRQKNILGQMLGLGCSLSIGLMTLEYFLMNLGLLPETKVYFPLLSFGGTGMCVCCILLGILLSIYRYQNVASDPDTDQDRRHLRMRIWME